jgi:hypothetical protein
LPDGFDGFVPAAEVDEFGADVDAADEVAPSDVSPLAASWRLATLCLSVCANGTAAGPLAESLPADAAGVADAADEPELRTALMAAPAVSIRAPSRGRGA